VLLSKAELLVPCVHPVTPHSLWDSKSNICCSIILHNIC